MVEALVAALVAGLAIVGIALMFGTGSAWVAVLGDDRVALGLAEQQIEQIRDAGWGAALNRLGPSAEACVRLGGRVPAADAGACPVEERTFSRLTCVQYVDAATREALAGPAVTAECAPAVPLGAVPTVRVTVTVAQNGQPKATPIVLQAWLSETGR